MMLQDSRPVEQIHEHYELEKRLAARLRTANRDERPLLYQDLYDELLRKLPHHPLLQVRSDKDAKAERDALVLYELGNLRPFLKPGQTYMEIGPGDCAVALAVARIVRHVYAVDVSAEITKNNQLPANFSLALSHGTDIPVPPGSIDVAFSSQLMEHLHPEDAAEQLRNICAVLKPGGRYLCITPNRLNGPHDVSRGFDQEPTGFHLREYTIGDLRTLFLQAGFASVRVFVRAGRISFQAPTFVVTPVEWLLDTLPYGMRTALASMPVLRNFLGVKLVGIKG